MTPHGHLRTLAIIIPTLTFYLVTVVEAYAWLSPPEHEQISGPEAVFRGFHLLPYFGAIVFQAFLTYACTNPELQGDERYFVWQKSFVSVLLWYAAYNAFWIIKRGFFDKINPPTYTQSLLYILFYIIFAAAFGWLLPWLEVRRPETAIWPLYVLFIVLYLYIWKGWYPKSFLYSAPPPATAVRTP